MTPGPKETEEEKTPEVEMIEITGNDAEENPTDDKPAKNEEFVDTPWRQRMWEVFITYWSLGFIAFGGPQAHVAILREHLVVQRDWMDEEAFTELFAIGQGLPGPTSTQLVVSTALARAGPLGGLMAFFMWNFPGLIVLTVCGVLIATFIDPNNPPWYLIGLPPAAICLVFKAAYGFGSKLDKLGLTLASISCMVSVLIDGDEHLPRNSSQYIYPALLVAGGLFTFFDSKRKNPFAEYAKPRKGWDTDDDLILRRIGIPIWVGALIFVVWAFVLAFVICLKTVAGNDDPYLDIFETMYRIGSIIFGGGQVVLPMLESEVVPDWMSKSTFFQGLGLAQSMPGPLFNFSSYLGAVYKGVPGALLAYVGLFGPGVILIFGMVPFWARARHLAWFKAVLHGVNATAIGFVGAACVVLWEQAIDTRADAIVFVFAGTLSLVYNVQAPLVVLGGGILGAILCDDAASLGQIPFCISNGYVEPTE